VSKHSLGNKEDNCLGVERFFDTDYPVYCSKLRLK